MKRILIFQFMDGEVITGMRTAAASAAATKVSLSHHNLTLLFHQGGWYIPQSLLSPLVQSQYNGSYLLIINEQITPCYIIFVCGYIEPNTASTYNEIYCYISIPGFYFTCQLMKSV